MTSEYDFHVEQYDESEEKLRSGMFNGDDIADAIYHAMACEAERRERHVRRVELLIFFVTICAGVWMGFWYA